MVRGLKFILIFGVATITWILALMFSSSSGNAELKKMLLGLPSYSLICFGCYALYEIGKGLAYLKDYPEEHTKILQDIQRAKAFYAKNGLNILKD